ncbi:MULTISPECIES: hypothetical protein [Arthrobacter]|uniref:Uncharacterized protein n=1 Tax=Arthrobacter caoxuetaonis TaxID=2886935 RepID=A0A9X1SCU3_9MICC|nr:MULTISPECIES: hypothetical protein [Arthrobacter]MCC3282873.1 hypothetical protein [Arthrobacter caoxuetaonis]MCC3298001.1 hypothetical protein [Arthrobacter caoxuetaonis]MCC9192199.1 hypothetical protein [Arthrobacter sp. zg-Y916]USQ57015.1 hypothetical protein NF551_14975 [Arthrobacter caoxuetaonis]
MTVIDPQQEPSYPAPDEDALSTLAMAASNLEAQQWAVDRAEQVLTDLVQSAVSEGLETGSIAAVAGLTTEQVEKMSAEGSTPNP